MVIDCVDWPSAVELARRCCGSALDLHLCTVLEADVVARLPAWDVPDTKADRVLLLVAPDAVSTVEQLASDCGAAVVYSGEETAPCRPWLA